MTTAGLLLKRRLGLDRPPVAGESERWRRQRLGEFLQQVEPTVHSASGEARNEIRSLLGWDDSSLHAFIGADPVVHTSPHASMNAFEPMFAFPWVAARLGSSSTTPSRAVHLRTAVTHNNLGDLRWRPYAWWHRGRDGSMIKTTLFTRNSKLRHQVLLAKPVPQIDLSACASLDREATALAQHARNYAYFCMVYRSFVERCAGLHDPLPTIEVPIDLLNAFSFHEDGVELWAATLAHFGMAFRTTDAASRLAKLTRPSAADLADARKRLLLCPNAINIFQAHLLGISFMVGAEQMSEYVPEMNDLLGLLAERLGVSHRLPAFVGVTDVPIADVLEHDPTTIAWFAADGLRGSLPVGAADIGRRIAANLDRLLSADHECFCVPPAVTDRSVP